MKTPFKDVLILLPGIMGSTLTKKDKPIWDFSAGALGRALYSLGESIQDLKLGSDTSEGDGVAATSLLADVHLFPGLWKIDGYFEVKEYLKSKFDLIPDHNYFEFPYDWRLDNRISARRLKNSASKWLESWKEYSKWPDPKLVFIAHSMGGLVARYFLECLEGWKETKTLITLGTPHRGSVKALDFLVNGMRKKLGPITLLDLTDMLRSFPSVYQLLPTYECVGYTQDNLVSLDKVAELGNMDMQRARAGLEFHREIERAVKKNRKIPKYKQSRYNMLPIVGTYQPTYLSALITDDGVNPIKTYKRQTLLEGDGTVPRLSATPTDLVNEGRESFVICPHASLQNFSPARVQTRATLEDVDISEVKALAANPLSLEIDDLYSSSQGFHARARCPSTVDPIQAVITNLDTGEDIPAEFEYENKQDDWQQLDPSSLPELVEGAYRIKVEAGSEVEPISDVFMVME